MNEFIVIDFETATYSPESAISVGLVKYRNYKPVDSFYSLIRPPKLYVRPDFTEKIHGLIVDDVKDAPDFKYLWKNEISAFIGPKPVETPIAAHSAWFDMKVLQATLEHYRIKVPSFFYFCSLKLSRRVWPELKSHKLTALANNFKIKYEAHNALADADTCARVISLCAMELSARAGRKRPMTLAKVLETAGVEMEGI